MDAETKKKSLKSFIRRMAHKSDELTYGRNIISGWVCDHVSANNMSQIKILDVGCGQGNDLEVISQQLKSLNCHAQLFGIDYSANYLSLTKAKGIQVHQTDIEHSIYPFQDHFFDVVICNQVLEHTKEIFWICNQIHRILKPNGLFVVGVPNLASLHNRILLATGEQPSCIEIYSEHIRGFTKNSAVRFFERDDYLKVSAFAGSNFYPFGPTTSNFLSKLFPGAAVTIFFKIHKTQKNGNFLDIVQGKLYETNYFVGQGTIS